MESQLGPIDLQPRATSEANSEKTSGRENHREAELQLASRIRSPKISAVDKKRSIYPYYAGYSESFVESVFDLLGISPGDLVLDPWNGGGTTTYVASTRGVRSTGIDVNPVLSSIARARAAGPRAVVNADRALQTLVDRSASESCDWLSVVQQYRRAAIDAVLPQSSAAQATALIDLVFFRTTRAVAGHRRSANPTWFKARDEVENVEVETLNSELRRQILAVIDGQRERSRALRAAPRLYSANFNTWRGLRAATYDYVVTSPPYLTRIDYVKATYPELQLILDSDETAISNLRRQMLGTPLTANSARGEVEIKSPEANRVLKLIRSHGSKASATYYYRFYAQYLVGLETAMRRLMWALKPGGVAAVVVQPSYYKEHLVDLARIVAELGCAEGALQLYRVDFPQTRSMVNVNRRAVGYPTPAFSEISKARHFFAHRNEETASRALSLALARGLAVPLHAWQIVDTHLPSKPYSVLDEWIYDLNQFQLLLTD